MARKFKSKRRISIRKTFKVLLVIIIIYMVFQIFEYLFLNIKLTNSNEVFINYMIEDSNYYSLYKRKKENIIEKIINYLSSETINKPINILENAFKYKNNSNSVVSSINDTTPDDKLVYIYSSHPNESYNMDYLTEYNITPTVFMASYILKEKLEDQNIGVTVLEENVSNYLKSNNMNYSKSYLASRHFIEPIINENKSILLYIDLHRDSATSDVTKTTINNLPCAKIMFVVGKDYDSYQKNLALANYLNDKIVTKYKNISRGVMQKTGEGVNGVYNQDLSENMILLELGGNENNIDEITNTINLISPIIGEYVNEKRK